MEQKQPDITTNNEANTNFRDNQISMEEGKRREVTLTDRTSLQYVDAIDILMQLI